MKMIYGKNAKVGNTPVFSREGAVSAYKIFCGLWQKHGTMEASVVCSNAADDMHALGFSWEEIEAIEIEVAKAA